MQTLNKKNKERNSLPINKETSHSNNASYTFEEKIIALACISFFPLVYLIGSSIVKYFGNS